MNRRAFFAAALAAFGLVTSWPAAAENGFGRLPTTKGTKPSPLLIRIVKYDGSTNGAITVDIKNPTDEPQEFTAKGVYFVPKSDADEAPQRLGAVGPFLLHGAGKKERREQMTVAPGAIERLSLDVYCIDSHRASPNSATSFRVAKDRVPEALTHDIAASAGKAAATLGGLAAPAAKPAVQAEVWRNRDKKWIELDGEGAQEKGKKR